MKRNDIENAILSTFLFANDYGESLENIYKLNVSIFSTPLKKRIAEKINSVKDGAYSFTSFEIEESISGTKFEFEFLEILSQNYLGLTLSKKYHDKLVKDDEVNKLC